MKPVSARSARISSVRPSVRSANADIADVYAISTTAGLERTTEKLFPGTFRVTRSQRGDVAPTLELVTARPERFTTAYDVETDAAIYCWGRATHPKLAGESTLRFALQAARSKDPTPLRELLGNFVIILDDRRARRITFISDALGLRPWFVGMHRGQLVCGSNVPGICRAGLSNGQVDYDAVSCWLKYNHDMTGGSVVRDYKQLLPGTIDTYDATGELISRVEYSALEYTNEFLPPDEMADRIHASITLSLETQTRGLHELNMPLSGGYDSRLLFALACRAKLNIRAVTLETREYEVSLAREVAGAMGHPLEVIESKPRILDLFDDPFAFSPSGFPTGRNLTSALARHHSDMPLISGFLGDGVMRGGLTPKGREWWAKDYLLLNSHELTSLVHDDYTMHANRFQLLRDRVAKNIGALARACTYAVIERGQNAGKPLLFTDLHTRHRLYFANVFLQHLDVAEAIVPIHSWDLLNCRTSHIHRCYHGENYKNLFARHFPQLANIGHTSKFIPNATNKRVRPKTPPSRHLRRFAADIAAVMVLTDCLEGTKKKRILSLLPGALLGEAKFQDEIHFIYKLQLFERKLRSAGVQFDWDEI